MRGLPTAVQGVLNAFATGILVFLLWDILSHAGTPVEAALKGGGGLFAGMAVIFRPGLAAGPLALLYLNPANLRPLPPGSHRPRPRHPAKAHPHRHRLAHLSRDP